MSTSAADIPTGTYVIDPARSRVEFSVKHLRVAKVTGTFSGFEGTLELSADLEEAKASGTVDVSTIDTNEAQRDEVLVADGFFDTERFPKMTFASQSIRANDGALEIAGDLTIRDTTRPIALKAKVRGTETDPHGEERLGLEVSGELDRRDYGMKFSQAHGSGDLLVSDRVKLSFDLSAIKTA